MVTHGQEIIWSHFGSRESVTVGGCDTREEAMREALKLAKESGWTPPRWWQWWRWGDRNYERT
jgi:hypothetical protein